ncbi:MAG TPA: tyrosine-type recombinase/integrase [Verrucomicrobiae bacterium]|nr:tyrosine-type recombinase/integrase [Verrucomicrobiae bacterium]
MSLFKRGNVWWTYYYIDGVRHQESTGATNRRQADAIEMKLKAEANARRHRIVEYDPHLTVAALAARFLGDADPRPHHVWHLKSLLPYFGDLAVVRLNRNMAREYRAFRKNHETVCDATINRALSVLKHILFWAVDEQIIQENPLARLPMVQERRLKRPVMTLDEENQLFPVLPEYLRNIVIAALDTGMRRGEVLKQQWEDVDLSRKLLLVSSSKTPGGESREIPLTARMLETLGDKRKEGHVFTYEGRALEWIRKGWLGGLKRAGLRHFRFHDLRHTFNTRLMEAGVIADVRMALMGHSSGEKVHSIYTHVELPIKRQAIARLEVWVKQQQEELKEQKDKEQKDASTEERSESARPRQD